MNDPRTIPLSTTLPQVQLDQNALRRTPWPPGTREVIAAAIANARGMRRGVPTIVNILDILPAKLRDEVLDDADNVMEALLQPFRVSA